MVFPRYRQCIGQEGLSQPFLGDILDPKEISSRQPARELDIGHATPQCLLDARSQGAE